MNHGLGKYLCDNLEHCIAIRPELNKIRDGVRLRKVFRIAINEIWGKSGAVFEKKDWNLKMFRRRVSGFLAFALSLLPEERVVFFLLVFFSAMIPFLFQKIIVRMMASTPITQQ